MSRDTLRLEEMIEAADQAVALDLVAEDEARMASWSATAAPLDENVLIPDSPTAHLARPP